MIKAVFWDNDGVLVDTEQLYFEVTCRELAEIGIRLAREDFIQWILVEARGVLHLAKQKGYSDRQVAALRLKRDQAYLRALDQGVRVLDGVEEVLKSLRGRVTMGLVTSSLRAPLERMHRSTGLLPYFDFVLTSDDTPAFKPDPAPYLMALDRAGCQREECLVVEDSQRGLAAALAAGIPCLVIPTPLTRGCDFTGARRKLTHVRQVLEEI